VGHFSAGSGISLIIDGAEMPLPARLGWEHG
jgi:thiamine-monophosphate kinase